MMTMRMRILLLCTVLVVSAILCELPLSSAHCIYCIGFVHGEGGGEDDRADDA